MTQINQINPIYSRLLLLVLLLCGLMLSAQAQQPVLPATAQQQLDAYQQARQRPAIRLDALLGTDAYSESDGSMHFYFQQQYGGIRLRDARLSLHFDKDQQLRFAADRLEHKLENRVVRPKKSLPPAAALDRALAAVDINARQLPVLKSVPGTEQLTQFEAKGVAQQPIPVYLQYVRDQRGYLRLSWQTEIYTTDGLHYWIVDVDAETGEIIARHDAVRHCQFDSHLEAAAPAVPLAQPTLTFLTTTPAAGSGGNYYRIFNRPVESPNHGSRSLVNTAGDPVASPFGWHHDGLLRYNITRGNNVHAYEDQLGANVGRSPIGGLSPLSPLNFDFPLDLSKEPSAYTDAAVTNLFYWNNLMHDVFWHYGFTEAAGNFQANNRGAGGLGGDAVMAEAQDGSGTNNANFLTLPDGLPGRMQMFLWGASEPAELVHVQSSASWPGGGRKFIAQESAFGPGVSQTAVTGELVLVQSNALATAGTSTQGCGAGNDAGLPPANDVLGKIVLIDRGNCNFIEKVLGAQLGGAAGVIVANNVPGEAPSAMGGAEAGTAVLIPSVMISYEDGLELKDEIVLGTITVSLQRLTARPPQRDGDLDNGVIAHEYGHGISIRLTGGPSNTLTVLANSEQQGEGWSDYFGLLMTMTPEEAAAGGAISRGIGTYVTSQPLNGGGIRPAPYSTDMSVNAYTYDDIDAANIAEPHGVGFIWCTMLWEMTWKFIEAYGFSADIYNGNGGNNMALRLVMDALKLQAPNPSFVDARDAILAADEIRYGGANACLIWEAFAKRGLGYSAVAGTNERGDEIEAFDMPPSCTPAVALTKDVNLTQVAPNGELTYTLTVTNPTSLSVSHIRLADPLPSGTAYVAGSASNGGSLSGGAVKWPAFKLNPGQTATRTFRVRVTLATGTDVLFADDTEDGISAWNPSVGLDFWHLQDRYRHSGSTAWFAADPDRASNQTLTLAQPVTVVPGTQLRFWHRFHTEATFDGGVVEISNDGGLTWANLGPQFLQNGYTDYIPAANNPLISNFAFGGNSNGWIQSIATLESFVGQSVLIRFRFSSDAATPGEGWYIDDIEIAANPTEIKNTANLTAAQALTATASASTLVVNNSNQAPTPDLVNDEPIEVKSFDTQALQALLYPNPAQGQIQLTLTGLSAGNVETRLLTLQGQEVQRWNWTTDGGTLDTPLSLNDVPRGLYLLRVQQAQTVLTLRLTLN